MEMKKEISGSVEFAQIQNGGNIEIPDTMWDNINRNATGTLDEGFLVIESMGYDTYRIKRISQGDISVTQINIPDILQQEIKSHINDNAIQREFNYTSVEDFIFRAIKDTINCERDHCYIN